MDGEPRPIAHRTVAQPTYTASFDLAPGALRPGDRLLRSPVAARFAVGSALVTASWFGVMTAASDAYYGILISLVATFAMVALGTAWERYERS